MAATLATLGITILFLVIRCSGGIPEDDAATWPSPALVGLLSKQLKGTLLLPNTTEYMLQTEMKNTRFNSWFGIVVMAESTEDVQKAVMFCKRFGVRPTIKSSGHDYIGRSAGEHTVSINLSRMKKISIQSDHRSTATNVSAVVEPGNSWADVYQRLHEAGYLIVGGSAHTVSPGGYTLGGGHSPMSRMFGLGVDNVIEFTLVTPNGTIITLSKDGGTIQHPGSSMAETYNDPELFWAVRGGGGGTYGVITSFTYQVHAPPGDGFCRYLGIYPMDMAGYNVGKEVIKLFSRYLLYNLTDNWGGYLIFSSESARLNASNPSSPQVRGFITMSLLHVGSCTKAQPQIDLLRSILPDFAFGRQRFEYQTFWDYEKDVNDETGFRTYIINRFIQREDLHDPERLATVLTDMIDVKKPIGGTWTLLGGKVRRTPWSSSSVSKDFRTAYGSLSLGTGWEDASEDAEYISAMREYGEKLYTIGSGVFNNEPDQFLENWKEEYWGDEQNYERLLAVKLRIDPEGMFWCLHCVASDLFYNSAAGLSISVVAMALALLLTIFCMAFV